MNCFKDCIRGIKRITSKANSAARNSFSFPQDVIPALEPFEIRFSEIEKQVDELKGMLEGYCQFYQESLERQIEYCDAVAGLHQPFLISIHLPICEMKDDLDFIDEIQDYRELLQTIQQLSLCGICEMGRRVIGPISGFQQVLGQVRGTITRRENLKVHLETQKANLFAHIQNPLPVDMIIEIEAVIRSSNNDIDELNDALRTELPQLFQFTASFFRDMLGLVYFKQLFLYHTLSTKMNEFSEIGRVKKLDTDEVIAAKRREIDHIINGFSVVSVPATCSNMAQQRINPLRSRRLSSCSSPMVSCNRRSSIFPEASSAARSSSVNYCELKRQEKITKTRSVSLPPKVDHWHVDSAEATSSRTVSLMLPKSQELATALFDYKAQNDEELSFKVGDRIVVFHKTSFDDDWWIGRVNADIGMFPGNYVTLTS